MLMLTLTVFTYEDLDYRHTEQFCLNYCASENSYRKEMARQPVHVQ